MASEFWAAIMGAIVGSVAGGIITWFLSWRESKRIQRETVKTNSISLLIKLFKINKNLKAYDLYIKQSNEKAQTAGLELDNWRAFFRYQTIR